MILDGLRVLDTTTGVAGPYCTKLLADAGADVVQAEPEGDDPLRHHRSGLLYEYLHASKRSVDRGDGAALVSTADVYVTESPVDLDALWAVNRPLVVLSVTPFGTSGPWAGRPSTEFTLQAACGSIGQRGLPEQPPLAAGGRVGEWVTGTYAAVGALAAQREARRSGIGEHVDVAMLDCMALTMTTFPSVVASFTGWPPIEGTGRTVEVPSVEPTKDGYVVFTTNSAQQFQDFLVMIGRSDWLEDTGLTRPATRFARREEFWAAVRAYTTARTTAEVLDDAEAFRIPAGPVLDGSTIESFGQFVDRQIFGPSPSGRFRQPRVPWRISGALPRPFGPPSTPAQHRGQVDWPAREDRRQAEAPWRLPLAGVRVVDCTAWWAGPVATDVLAILGADVVKVESVSRPDGMRLASTRPPTTDQWWEWGAIFHGANVNKRGVTLDLARAEGREVFERLVGTADVLVENYTPRVMEHFGLDWAHLSEGNPGLVMVRMPAFGLDGPWRDRTGFAQTMECLAGMASVTGFADGPPVLVRGACDPLAGLHSVLAVLLALVQRERSGAGCLVETAMVEAALNAAAEPVLEYSSWGTVLARQGNRGPGAAPQGVYRCLGSDRWLAVAVATDDQWRAACTVMGHPEWAEHPELADPDGRHHQHDELDRRLGDWAADLDAEEAADQLGAAGVPAATVVVPRDIAQNPQLRARGFFELERHPVTGDHELPVLPMRFGHVEAWLRSAAPILGQHNDEVLGELGLDPEAIATLRAEGVVGERPIGL